MKRRSGLHNDKRAYHYSPSPVSLPPQYWITTGDTMWLYPIVNVQAVLQATTDYIRNGNQIVFASKEALQTFYGNVNASCAVSQPVGNVGYSLGVGTVVKDLNSELTLVGGDIVITWRFVQQITNQSALPSGGNSPNGTIGYACFYENWLNQDFINDGNLDNTDRGYLRNYTG